jgi:hypothetical protein
MQGNCSGNSINCAPFWLPSRLNVHWVPWMAFPCWDVASTGISWAWKKLVITLIMTSNARQSMRSSPLQQGIHNILLDFDLYLASACGAGTEVSSMAAQFHDQMSVDDSQGEEIFDVNRKNMDYQPASLTQTSRRRTVAKFQTYTHFFHDWKCCSYQWCCFSAR